MITFIAFAFLLAAVAVAFAPQLRIFFHAVCLWVVSRVMGETVYARGEYFGRVNGGAWAKEGDNLIVLEGLAHILNVAFGTTPKPSSYHLALFSGTAAPAANWTAASFAATANEITSMTEGYTSPTRPVWTPTNTNSGSIDNMTEVASVTFATASEVTVTGAAMLTSSARGGTTGSLISATKYASERKFQDGDTYDIGYRVSLTV